MADEIKTPALLYIQNANLPAGTKAWLSTDMQTQAVDDALRVYSRYFPFERLFVITGDGTALYDLSTKIGATWLEGFSGVIGIEYPYDEDDIGANLLDGVLWNVVAHPTFGKTLRFEEALPSASEEILVRYIGQHTEATVRADHLGAVAKLAAGNLCLSLAARTSSFKESTVGGNWNPSGAKMNFDSMATKFRKEAEYDLGVGKGASAPAAAGAACAIKGMNTDKLTGNPYGRLIKRRARWL